MGSQYHLVIGLTLATLVLAAPQDSPKQMEDEARGHLKRAVLPFLIGTVLKVSTLVPLKLMLMTFIVVMALVTSKIGLLLALVTGLFQHYGHGKSHSGGNIGVGAGASEYLSTLAASAIVSGPGAFTPSNVEQQASHQTELENQPYSAHQPGRRVHHYGR